MVTACSKLEMKRIFTLSYILWNSFKLRNDDLYDLIPYAVQYKPTTTKELTQTMETQETLNMSELLRWML